MNKVILLTLVFCFLFSFSLISAEEFGYNFLEPGENLNPSTNFSKTNVNSSEYWDNMNTINTTQMEDNGGVLNILESWIVGLVASATRWIINNDNGYLYNDTTSIYFNDTQLNITIDARASGLGDNRTWNETLANSLYAKYQFTNNNFNGSENFTGDVVSGNKLLMDVDNALVQIYDINTNAFLRIGRKAGEELTITGNDNDIIFEMVQDLDEGSEHEFRFDMDGSQNFTASVYKWSFEDDVHMSMTKSEFLLDEPSFKVNSYSLINDLFIGDFGDIGIPAREGFLVAKQNPSGGLRYGYIGHENDGDFKTGIIIKENNTGIVGEEISFIYDEREQMVLNDSGLWLEKNITADTYFGDGSQLTGISGGNSSWNETRAFDLFAPNTTEGIQYLINSTGVYSTYNETYATNVGNLSWNETLGHKLFDSTYNVTYAGLINNASYLSTYNETYAIYVTLNYTNKSNYWDNMNTINTTQMEDNGGVLNILVSWLTSLFYQKSEVYNKTETYNKSEVYNQSEIDDMNFLNSTNFTTIQVENITGEDGGYIRFTDKKIIYVAK